MFNNNNRIYNPYNQKINYIKIQMILSENDQFPKRSLKK